MASIQSPNEMQWLDSKIVLLLLLLLVLLLLLLLVVVVVVVVDMVVVGRGVSPVYTFEIKSFSSNLWEFDLQRTYITKV